MFIALYLFALSPNKGRQNDFEAFKKTYIAHRGLFNNVDVPENSLLAFGKAKEENYGIELDLQLTADNKVVVFHDKTLERMCNSKATIQDLSYEELSGYNLLSTDQKIPLFEEVLALVDGKVPLIVEIKSHGDFKKTSELANNILSKYNGKYCIESFHPSVLRWYKVNAPEVLRGQLSTNYNKSQNKPPVIVRFFLSNLLLNFYSKPDFIAYNHNYKNLLSYRICRKFYKPVNVAWTVRNQEDLEKAKDTFSIFIFDSFIPYK